MEKAHELISADAITKHLESINRVLCDDKIRRYFDFDAALNEVRRKIELLKLMDDKKRIK